MQYAEIIVALGGGLLLAWVADLLTGRRGLFATLVVSSAGVACGCFLAVRVFAVSTLDSWPWVLWSMIAAVVCLGAFFLFRNKR